MSFILSKILLFILKPILWIGIAIIFSLAAKNNLKRKNLLWLAFILFLLFSNAFICSVVYRAYEAQEFPTKQYDVGILLGGFSKTDPQDRFAFSERGDRLAQTIRLYKTGVIKKILVSGGSGKLMGKEPIEADLTVHYLQQIGIPDSAILRENKSRNTIENAKFSYALLEKTNPKPSVLIITSAWHIPRSKVIFNTIFKKELSYYPTDFIGIYKYSLTDFFLPDPSALVRWEYILKEWVGLLVDRIRVKI
ncbi:YdcF family protein [Pedobacter sp. MW01-1-1]|uniref:YdcF family protein n=1 Tax=Pedobacter sp. MW01-1-1 TaxID=3383027 RepID=UPI003FEFD4F7